MKFPAILLTTALLASSAHSAFAQSAHPINVAAEGFKKTAQAKQWKTTLDGVTKVGTASQGLFCSGSKDLFYTAELHKALGAFMYKGTKEKLAALGYPKYLASESSFEGTTGNGADFSIGYTVTSMTSDICVASKELSGTVKLQVRAELYSNKLQKVVYSRSIEGSNTSAGKVAAVTFYETLVANVLDQMFADPAYVAANRDDAAAQVAAVTGDHIAVRNGAKPKDGISKDSKDVLSAVVTIETGVASGSGFYIGRDGYIITDAHVVADAKFVKVRLRGGFTVPGEVIRKDIARDVALIKTDVEPPVPMFVRAGEMQPGGEVYAIGSPFGAQLSSTVTRGVFSGVRKSNEMNFIQSDVAVNPGNSGGPLVDADGGLVALCVGGVKAAQGINLFIPIGEALDRLGLELK